MRRGLQRSWLRRRLNLCAVVLWVDYSNCVFAVFSCLLQLFVLYRVISSSFDMPTSPDPTASPDLSALDYVPLIPYNETIMTGGDSLTQNLNVYYEVGFCLFCEMVESD